MSSYRLALFVRIGGQFLSVLLSALLVLTFLTSGRSHEPMLFTSIALAAAGAGWFQARIAEEPIRRRWLRAMTGLVCLLISVAFGARAVQLIWR